MLQAESRTLKREILEEIGGLLRDELAASCWGRILVGVRRGEGGEAVVAGIDVEEVICDEAAVDDAFAGEKARQFVPVLAKAVEALCALDGLDLDDVGGGTFVRRPEGEFAWLPALVHSPSPVLDAARDDLMGMLRQKHSELEAIFGFPTRGRAEVDLLSERLSFVVDARLAARARATLVGTFAPRSRTWGWAGSHPHVPERVRRASAALIDGILDRGAWELSTPVFATDESTAWVLSAWVADRVGGDGVLCSRETDGLVFFLLRDFHGASG